MLFSDRVGAPTSPLFIIIPHFLAFVNICNEFFRNFFAWNQSLPPPAGWGPQTHGRARPEAAHGRAKGRGGPARENGAAGGTRAGRARHPSRKQTRARAGANRVGGGRRPPRGGGRGEQNPDKTRARPRRRCRCFYSIKRPRPTHRDKPRNAGTNGHKRENAGRGRTRNNREPNGSRKRPQGGPRMGGGPANRATTEERRRARAGTS